MNNWFNVPTAQTPIFVLFLSAGVLFDGAFSLWVSLIVFSELIELSFEEAAKLRPETPTEMWNIVKQTSPKDAISVKPTSNRKGWKTIRLFVSSTFKDFHQEREVLVKEVGTFVNIFDRENQKQSLTAAIILAAQKKILTKSIQKHSRQGYFSANLLGSSFAEKVLGYGTAQKMKFSIKDLPFKN